MSRSELREHIFKLLFGVEFNDEKSRQEQVDLHFDINEVTSEKDMDYIRSKYSKILENLSEIDDKINATAVGWKTKRMNKVDLSILRLAFYEVLMDEDVPTGVAINEAVELAKKYSSDEGPSFVNGVLAKLVNKQ
jgi:N utilization substance protein B